MEGLKDYITDNLTDLWLKYRLGLALVAVGIFAMVYL